MHSPSTTVGSHMHRAYVPSALPPTGEALSQKVDQPEVLSAYELCFTEERIIGSLQGRVHDLVCVRILGWMLVYATTTDMRLVLAKAIESCRGDSEHLYALGKFFIDFWVRTFRKYRKETPDDSNQFSRPLPEAIADEIKEKLVAYPANNESVARCNALIRDGFRCVVTRAYEEVALEENEEVLTQFQYDETARQAATKCAHIICGPTNLDIARNQDRTKYAASGGAWAVLKHLGYEELFTELNGTNIHRLSNVLTLDSLCYKKFDTLRLWFEQMDSDLASHCYHVRSTSDAIFRQIPKTVEFTDASNGKLEMPSKRYLALHATCAKVANLSGAAQYLDDLDERQEDELVLASDGSSVHVFENALCNAFSSSRTPQVTTH